MDDAIAETRKKRPRIGQKSKAPSREELARMEAAKMLRVDTSVWDIINAMKRESAKAEAAKFGDPLSLPFKNDNERLRYNKMKYAKMSIVDAFADSYGLKIQVDNPEIEAVPREVRVGDTVTLKILNISKKGGVVFDSGTQKENFITRDNLGKYSKFEHVLPVQPINARVTEVGKKAVVVDILDPMVQDFVQPRVKNNWIQNLIKNPEPVFVSNLHLVKGGYLGKVAIPNVTNFIGELYEVDAFVPGSQIVLNTTDNFEEFEGQTIEAFITGYSPKPNGKGYTVICSRKNYLKHHGHLNMIELHKMWCDDGDEWKEFVAKELPGRITGVINSSKKCGAFVEVPYLNITGMILLQPDELVEYPMNKWINVKLKTFEEEMVYNDSVGQLQRVIPFEIENGALKKVNIKPIFELA